MVLTDMVLTELEIKCLHSISSVVGDLACFASFISMIPKLKILNFTLCLYLFAFMIM